MHDPFEIMLNRDLVSLQDLLNLLPGWMCGFSRVCMTVCLQIAEGDNLEVVKIILQSIGCSTVDPHISGPYGPHQVLICEM